MIPYFQMNQIIMGPIVIQVWGLFVATGIIAGVLLAARLGKKYFLSDEVILDAAIWMMISAFIFARVFHVVFYDLDFYLVNPGEIIKFWKGGLSSTGGFFGALLALYVFVKQRKFKIKEFWPYLDVMAVGLWLGIGIGRIGCFVTHMHPGRLTNSFLGVNFPTGTRFEMGLFESVLGFSLFILFFALFRNLAKIRWGLVVILSSLTYAVTRFFFDFLRATDLPQSDARYANLTPAQWAMAVVILGLTVVLFSVSIRRQKEEGRIA